MRRTSIILLCLMAPALARGGSWFEQVANAPQGLFVVDAVTADIAWAAGDAGVVIRTVDSGANWELRSAPSGDIRAMSARDAMNCVVGDATGRLYRTTDGGAHWALVATAVGSFINGIQFFDDLHGWAVGDPVGGTWVILESADGGATWLPSPGAPAAGPGLGLSGSYSWVGSTIGAFGTGQWAIWRTTDGGASWNPITTDVRQVAGLVLDESGIALAGGDLDALDRSTDAGATWNLIGSPTPARLLAFSRVEDSAEVWGLTQQNGHFRSADGGISWTPYAFPTNYLASDMDFVAGGNGWSVGRGTAGGRVWRYDTAITDVIEPLQVSEARSLRVGPNPFSTGTTFVFVGRSSPIAICDVSGREVIQLQGFAGSTSIVWDGRDARGQELPGGVYFYRVVDDSRGFVGGRLVRTR
jgi:photosystem II stability/assembly factor-like uncharacterized protein